MKKVLIALFFGMAVLSGLALLVPYVSGKFVKHRIIGETSSILQVYRAVKSYQIDHGGALPQQLSLLVPDYVPVNDVRIFFNPDAIDFKERCKQAASDPTEIDRNPGVTLIAKQGGWTLDAERGDKRDPESRRIFRVDESGICQMLKPTPKIDLPKDPNLR